MREHLLNRAQIGAMHQQMGCKGMPEDVWRDVAPDAITCGPLLHYELQTARG
jgi:hypothetical protein